MYAAAHALVLATEAAPGEDASGSGLLLIAGLAAIAFIVGHATRRWVSEVIVFIVIGIVIGPEVIGLLDTSSLSALDPVIAVALGAIVFGIGERLELPALREIRHTLAPMALLENVAVFALILVGMLLIGQDIATAYLLAAIGLSTSPTTLVAVIGGRRAKGRFTDHLLALTALNNVTSAVLYGLGLPVILATRSVLGATEGVLAFAQLVLASLLIGGAGAFVLRRFMGTVHRAGERLLFVLVVLISVVAVSRSVSAPVVISTLIAGALTANDRRDTRPLFEALRTLEAPIFLVFFLVAGAAVHFEELAAVGLIGLVYVVARGVGKVGGGWIGADLTRSGRRSGWGPHVGGGLMPFAGMAIGLAAFTLDKASAAGLDDLGGQVSAIVLGSVVVFELIGPLTVGRSLDAAGDSGKDTDEDGGFAAAEPHMIRHILVPLSSPEMARRKAPQIMDLAASTKAVVTGLHVVPPGERSDPLLGDPALSYVSQVAASRNVQFEPVVYESHSIVEAITEVARNAAVDLVILGEPVPRLLERGGGRRIVHEIAARLPPGVRVLVVPTVLEEERTAPAGSAARAAATDADSSEPLDADASEAADIT